MALALGRDAEKIVSAVDHRLFMEYSQWLAVELFQLRRVGTLETLRCFLRGLALVPYPRVRRQRASLIFILNLDLSRPDPRVGLILAWLSWGAMICGRIYAGDNERRGAGQGW